MAKNKNKKKFIEQCLNTLTFLLVPGQFSFLRLGSKTNGQLEIISTDSFILTRPTEVVRPKLTLVSVGPLEPHKNADRVSQQVEHRY